MRRWSNVKATPNTHYFHFSEHVLLINWTIVINKIESSDEIKIRIEHARSTFNNMKNAFCSDDISLNEIT